MTGRVELDGFRRWAVAVAVLFMFGWGLVLGSALCGRANHASANQKQEKPSDHKGPDKPSEPKTPDKPGPQREPGDGPDVTPTPTPTPTPRPRIKGA